jgi:hypothetical protein
MRTDRPLGGPVVAVITTCPACPDAAQVCRVGIHLDVPVPAVCEVGLAVAASSEPDVDVGETESLSDIVVDYHDPEGPVIRHLRPTLMPLPDPRERT